MLGVPEVLLLIVIAVLTVLPASRICAKAGYLLTSSPNNLAAEDLVAAAESAAVASAATPEGKKFAADAGTAFGRDHGRSFQACAGETKSPDLSDFDLFLQVSGTGEVEQALVKPSTNLAACVRAKVKGWKVGVPPKADAWVSIHVRLQRK